MNSRRKFVKKTALATVALVATKPLQALASLNPFTSTDPSRFVLVHGNTTHTGLLNQLRPALVVSATGSKSLFSSHDISYHDLSDKRQGIVLDRDGKRIGIFPAESDQTMHELEDIAARLRSHDACELVVCISQLGFANGNGLDDRSLARGSGEIDIIISAHPTNFSRRPVVAANRRQEEVIIHSPLSSDSDCGVIELGFAEDGTKRSVALSNYAA